MKHQRDTKLHPGDVFATRMPDGRFGAVRIIRTLGKSSLVYTSPYLDVARPSLDDPRLRKPVKQFRFCYRDEPAMLWLDGKPPKAFEFVGCLAPTKSETKRECGSYGGGWCESTGNEAYLEWRWIHDRRAFEAEERKRDEEMERQRRRPQKPKKMMSEAKFWKITGRLNWERLGDDDKVLAPAVKALAAMSKSDICQFEERLAYLLYRIDTKAHAENIGEFAYDAQEGYISADLFLYARCVPVANGKAIYASVLKDPTKMPKDMEFEALLGLAPAAYELKTGDAFDYETGCSYESFSNRKGWS